MRSPSSHNSKESKESHASRNSYGSADNDENRPKPPTDRPPMVQRATSRDSAGSKSTVQTSFKSPGTSSITKSSSRNKDPNQQTHNVDFALNFFTNNDPAEAKLIDVLEGNTGSKATGTRRTQSGGNLHRRRGSKLPFLVKQMSSRKLLISNSNGSKDAENLNNTTYDATQPSSDNGFLPEEQNINGAGGLGNRRRAHSASRADVGSGMMRQRRSSAHAHELRPTSHYLSNLAENLDESDTFDYNHHSDEAQDKEGPFPSAGLHRRQKTSADAFADHAQQVFSAMPQESFDDLPSTFFQGQRRDASQDIDDNCSDISEDDGDDGRDVEGGPDVRRPLLGRRGRSQRKSPFKRAYSYLLAGLTLLGPTDIWNGMCNFLHRTFLMTIVPLLSVSAILFYGFKNPDLAFMPTDATLSWWLIFVCRMLVTFNLAKAAQYILTILTVRTTVTVRLAGPFVALIAMQSTGWPFLIAAFGGWNMLMCHGYHAFVKNWIWFLHIGMFSKEQNSDHGVLESTLYGRVLVSMIFVGAATAAKRTMVALYLSRRMLQYYRPQLQELLTDMKQVMEVAELAAETETEEFTQLVLNEHISTQGSYRTASTGGTRNNEGARALARNATKKLTKQVPTFSSKAPASHLSLDTSNEGDDVLLFSDDEEEEDDDDNEAPKFASTSLSEQSAKSGGTGRSGFSKLTDGTESVRSGQMGPVQWNQLKNQLKPKRVLTEKERSSSPIEMSSYAGEKKRTHQAKSTSNQRYDKLAPQLEDWEEPEEKGSKKSLPSLHDILQFRKAMEFMENPFPFSTSFGPARTRKECIKSATRVYKRLLRFTPGENVLHFDVIGALAYDEDEDLDEQRAQELLGVFLADKDDLLPQISFVQSCDYVYKHLRFLRAAINNSSKIDSVLEDVFDCIFYGALTILIMTLLGFNPWPLLVSFSTVMVSFAFAFGPSAAKWIEGTLMIAVRRPYDIGDRITINSAENLSLPTDSDTWLVEDISLTTTTLRFSSTNELCTVNNAAIANSRIVNCARSARAIVTIKAYFVITATQDQIETFRIRVENYLLDRPEIWAGLVHFRNNMVDYNQGYCEYLLRAQHQQEWQYISPVMVQKGELQKHMNNVATDLQINWQYQSYRLRLVEVPRLITTRAEEDIDDKEDHEGGVEPFMKFIKEETGY